MYAKTRVIMKTLIVYYSHTGNNDLLANEVCTRLDADLLRIKEKKHRNMFRIMLDLLFDRRPQILVDKVEWRRYDHVILMAPIWNLHIAHPMKTFIEQAKAHLRDYSFVTLCSGREGQEENIQHQLEQLTGRHPVAIAEMRIIDLLPPEKRTDAKEIGKFKLTDANLAKFAPKVDRFIQAIRAEEAIEYEEEL